MYKILSFDWAYRNRWAQISRSGIHNFGSNIFTFRYISCKRKDPRLLCSTFFLRSRSICFDVANFHVEYFVRLGGLRFPITFIVILRVLGHFFLDPRYVLGYVSVDSGQFWVGAFYAPADNSADEPSVLVLLILTQQRPSRISLEKKNEYLVIVVIFTCGNYRSK